MINFTMLMRRAFSLVTADKVTSYQVDDAGQEHVHADGGHGARLKRRPRFGVITRQDVSDQLLLKAVYR